MIRNNTLVLRSKFSLTFYSTINPYFCAFKIDYEELSKIDKGKTMD